MVRAPLLLALFISSLSTACLTDRSQHVTVWPPADFSLVVEEHQVELRDGAARSFVRRRFRVWANGRAVYGKASGAIEDPITGATLPVFSGLAAWQMLPESSRGLARKLHLKGVLSLAAFEGAGPSTTGGTSGIRLQYHAFGTDKVVAMSGQVTGNAARVLQVINAHLPAGEGFLLPGVPADHLPCVEVPAPAEDLNGSLLWHMALAADPANDPMVCLDLFALACRAKQRPAAVEAIGRWQAAQAAVAIEPGTVPPARLTRDVLERMLPDS
ncbi:MAG: hypothetical protein IPK26_02280 [Planctomycetes bacterium]|nr:hypothetical protein [Planctomycetota bacterium]